MDSFPWEYGSVCGRVASIDSSENAQNIGLQSTAGRGGLFSSSLVLDSERRELVKAPARLLQKGIAEAKAKEALKNHSEAERRRRERINTHLSTLRSLLPTTGKMDKASLLAEVISQVKELKRHAAEISKGSNVPSDVDEVRVEPDNDGTNKGSFSIKASLSCEDRPELLSDLKETLHALRMKTVRAEISSLGGRVKNVFVMTCEGHVNDVDRRSFASSVHQALKAVLDRVSSTEFSPRTALPNKRQRISLFDSSSSSS
ncbi:transcription factor bHLH30-like protein [Cinnamomum micranthum f. kanehirae]|uniref:Transcription factor bHLH30-like protein n=1 Tax=Cinnamomum micranthum f. kanehirae TaxID=337451 RepID=A0A443P6Y8_9MAGN|nr:transcription factor bHLH30-like protein [Cinnamomum micranthum f. kanehirae]